MDLKKELKKDNQKALEHLRKSVDDLKKKVRRHSGENEEIRTRHQGHRNLITRLQSSVSIVIVIDNYITFILIFKSL